MERTESIVIETMPESENAAIDEKQMFGWNLQGRQEVIGHLRDRALGTSDTLFQEIWISGKEGVTGKRTQVYDHYVKLHFVRNLDLPNLDKIKNLEDEYSGLPNPQIPPLVGPGPIIIIILGLLNLIFKNIGGGVVFLAIGGLWIYIRNKKQQTALKIRNQSLKRTAEIWIELSLLIDISKLIDISQLKEMLQNGTLYPEF